MLKNMMIHCFAKCGGIDLLRICNPMARIIFWHGVDNRPDDELERESISVESFERQIDYIAKHYEVISMDECFQRHQSRSFKGSEIVITFDDGYKNNLTCAAPVLKKHSLPFLIFVSANHVTEQKLFFTSLTRLVIVGGELDQVKLGSIGLDIKCNSRDERIKAADIVNKTIKTLPQDKVEFVAEELKRLISDDELKRLRKRYPALEPMTWDDVRTVMKMGATIGSHCFDHCCCHSNQPQEELRKQIFESKQVIEKELGTPCHYFAYPNGDRTAVSDSLVHEAGYRMGFATTHQKMLLPGEDTASIPRFGMMGDWEKSLIRLNMGNSMRKYLGV